MGPVHYYKIKRDSCVLDMEKKVYEYTVRIELTDEAPEELTFTFSYNEIQNLGSKLGKKSPVETCRHKFEMKLKEIIDRTLGKTDGSPEYVPLVLRCPSSQA